MNKHEINTNEVGNVANDFSYFAQEDEASKAKAHALLNNFVSYYHDYVQAVFDAIADKTSRVFMSTQLLCEAGVDDLSEVGTNIRITTSKEVSRWESLLEGIVLYMRSAESQEDKQGMLMYAVDELKTSAINLGLMRNQAAEEVWSSVASHVTNPQMEAVAKGYVRVVTDGSAFELAAA